jgi:hypothetical protein
MTPTAGWDRQTIRRDCADPSLLPGNCLQLHVLFRDTSYAGVMTNTIRERRAVDGLDPRSQRVRWPIPCSSSTLSLCPVRGLFCRPSGLDREGDNTVVRAPSAQWLLRIISALGHSCSPRKLHWPLTERHVPVEVVKQRRPHRARRGSPGRVDRRYQGAADSLASYCW